MIGASMIRILAPAKINLFLELHRKRPDGYHELETVMAAVELFDELTLEPADSPAAELDFSAEWDGDVVSSAEGVFGALPPTEKNLAFRALALLRRRVVETAGKALAPVRASLLKRVPAEAGLGGASSDAAAAFLAGNAFWGLGLSRDELSGLAAELGSDVPFFLEGGWAICRGRGELIEPLPDLPPIWVVIYRPPFGLSTPKVYGRCVVPETPERPDALLDALKRRDEDALAGQLVNRLWAPALEIEPRLGGIPKAFQDVGIRAHQMSGSGSSYFGITFDAERAQQAAQELRSRLVGFVAAARGGTKNACIDLGDTLSS